MSNSRLPCLFTVLVGPIVRVEELDGGIDRGLTEQHQSDVVAEVGVAVVGRLHKVSHSDF